MPQLSIEQRVRVAMWYDALQNGAEVQRKFQAFFASEAPSVRIIVHWYDVLLQTGSVLSKNRDRSKSVRSEENTVAVVGYFAADPRISTRRATNVLDISRTTIRRILKDFKFHPYKLQTVQFISDEDKQARLLFARQELDRIAADPSRLCFLVFSDEAHFHIDGGVNRHNCRYWSDTNPHWVTTQSIHSPRTTVWAGIWESGIFGPYFFDQTVNSTRYLEMLENNFWPDLQQQMLVDNCIFMQDGAPPHWAVDVRNFLNDRLPGRWMGRASPNMPWPARSPDLSPCDFFLWGYIKSIVYREKSATVEELKTRIRQAFADLPYEFRAKSLIAYRERLELCIEREGGHVEVEVVDEY
jgi:hypothetical protein